MSTRVYAVYDQHATAGSPPRLIRATSKSQAIRHASKGRYEASPASQEEIIRAMQAGNWPEDALAESGSDE